jgi:hypothetical protein
MTEADLTRWLEEYGRAWTGRDPEAAAGLFAADARYHETPFDAPMVGGEAIRQYWRHVPESQENIRFEATPVAVIGATGIARWRARFTRVPSGRRVELDGVFLLEFSGDGLCVELREWWHRREQG